MNLCSGILSPCKHESCSYDESRESGAYWEKFLQEGKPTQDFDEDGLGRLGAFKEIINSNNDHYYNII